MVNAMYYPVGWPLWKLLARLGAPLRFTLIVHFDGEACVFWAESPSIDGLVVEAPTLEEIRREAMYAADILLEMQLTTHRPLKLRIRPQFDMHAPLTARA